MISIHSIYRPISKFFRLKRMEQFSRYFGIDQNDHILDVGGTPFNWILLPVHPRVTLVNYHVPEQTVEGFNYIVADACQLPFLDSSFDIVYSNSVIEHLENANNQKKMAEEITRVGIQYYVQTPNKFFPIEPHYLAPFIHWLPKTIQPILVRYTTLRGWLDKPTLKACSDLVKEIRLMDESELTQLFPQAQVSHEKFFGLIKSLMVVKVTKPQ